MRGRRGKHSESQSVFDVFTPTSQARVNFVPRGSVNDSLVAALRTPGKQVIVYGESGSGKSTLLQKKLEELYTAHITSRCSSSTNFEGLLLDAFDKISPYYTEALEESRESRISKGLSAQFKQIRASIDVTTVDSSRARLHRALPPQLTAQRLGELMGALGMCWVLEDFHKVPEDQRTQLSQSLKTFSDLAAEYRQFKVVAIGATETARLVVEYDTEMANRVAEILVPLMTDDELRAIVDQGQGLMNVDLQDLRDQFVQYSVGVASVCHQLALNVCLNNEVNVTAADRMRFRHSDLEPALQRWVAESSDTLKATFDRALKRHKVRKYDNCRLILKGLAAGPFEGMLHSEILKAIREEFADYPPGNLTLYLQELQDETRGSILMVGIDGRYRFIDPLHHTFAQAVLLPPAKPVERQELYFFMSEWLKDWEEATSGARPWRRVADLSQADLFTSKDAYEIKISSRGRTARKSRRTR